MNISIVEGDRVTAEGDRVTAGLPCTELEKVLVGTPRTYSDLHTSFKNKATLLVWIILGFK